MEVIDIVKHFVLVAGNEKLLYFCGIIKLKNEMCIVEQTSRSITVRMSNARWNRLMELEQAYQAALAVMRAKAQCEDTPSMSIEDAENFILNL